MASADFNNVLLRNVAPANADGSFVHNGYVGVIGSDAKQKWTNDLNLNNIVVSSLLINSTLSLTAGNFITMNVSTGSISTLSTISLIANSTITTPALYTTNLTYSTLTGVSAITSSLTASSLGFSTGSGILLGVNGLVVNSTITTSTLNGTNVNYSTLQGNTLTTSLLSGSTLGFSTAAGGTLTAGLLNAINANVNSGLYSTLTGSSIATSTLSVSSLYYSSLIGSTVQTSTLTASTIGVSTLTGSTLNAALVNLNNGLFSTLTGSSIVTSTLSVSSLFYSSLTGSTLTTSTLVASTIGFSTIQGSTLLTSLLTATTANMNNGLYSTLMGSSITTSTLIVSTMGFSTVQGSTLVTATAVVQSTLLGSTVNAVNIGFSTLVGDTLVYNTAISNSTLTGSTVNAVNIGFSTLSGSTIVFNTAVSNSTLTGSTINATLIGYSTLQGSTITANTMAVQALTIGSTLTASSILTTSLGYSTMNGSTITTSTINVVSLLTSANIGIGLTNPTYTFQTSTLQTVNLSGNYIQDWTTVFSGSDATAFTPTFNGTQTGPSGSPLAMNVTVGGGGSNITLTFNKGIIAGNVYQLTLTAKMTGTSPLFVICDHIAADAIIAGTTQTLSGTYASYTITFTAPSGSFALCCTSQIGAIFSYYGVQLRAFVNQMIGGLGIGTTNPRYSLDVAKGSIQAYNFQQFEWINTQSNNLGAGLYKIATMGTTAAGYGMINVRGQIGGRLNTNTMHVDLTMMSNTALTVWGTANGNQPSAALQCDIVYCVNANSQYDIYINVINASFVYDLVVSGASGSNVLYDPAATAVVSASGLTLVSVSALANIYSNGGGNVGIGKTASATYKLDVNGTLNAAQILQGGVPIGSGGGSQWITAGSTIYYLLGNVGIGTNSLSANLHIYDPVASSSSVPFMAFSPNLYAAGSQYLYFGTANSTNNSAQLGWYNAGAGSASNYAFLQIYGRSNIMTWQASTGNVGIGIAAPQASLHIYGDTTSSVQVQLNEVKLTGNGNSHWSIFGARAGHAYFSIANTSINATMGTAGTDVLCISTTNNVGIGIVAPTAGLHIKNTTSAMRITGNLTNLSARPTVTATPGACEIRASGSADGNDDGFLRVSAGGGNSTSSQSYIDVSGYSTVTDMNSTIVFGTAGAERARITSTGTLVCTGNIMSNGTVLPVTSGSVWTTNGTAILYTAGNVSLARNRLVFSSASVPNDFNHSIFNNSNNWDTEGTLDGFKYNGYDGHWFRVGNASGAVPITAMFMNSTGKIGIGMTTQTFQLQLSTDSAAKPSSSTWTVSSDERLKENIILADIDRCLEIIRAVPLKHYRWKDEVYTLEQVKDRSKLGWIAQDVEKVFPKAVSTHPFHYNQVYKDVVNDEGMVHKELVSEDVIEDCRDLNADQMYAVMYGAIQKLIAVNDSLLARVEALERAS